MSDYPRLGGDLPYGGPSGLDLAAAITNFIDAMAERRRQPPPPLWVADWVPRMCRIDGFDLDAFARSYGFDGYKTYGKEQP